MGEAGGRHELHRELIPAHIEVNSLGSPQTPCNKIDGPFGASDQVGPSFTMGQFPCASSKKRPRIFRSPIPTDSPNEISTAEEGGNRVDIPIFPDLKNLAFLYSGSYDDSLSLEPAQSEGVFGAGSDTVIPESHPAGDAGEVDKEVADTIEVGNCVGIQVGEFVNHVRLLIHGEGVFDGLQ
ncbi:hypothetical protein L1987_64075 [Smallanthus sonchifolius]|uniref:Uncharacterized protein n=1 Tax=Smallanthus sonchifolius TaxID=185202 RepID=A0ACB9CF29_9ASTR|nr:hypothetical protein L1987_64075 [Smallanthus sonchifolius]